MDIERSPRPRVRTISDSRLRVLLIGAGVLSAAGSAPVRPVWGPIGPSPALAQQPGEMGAPPIDHERAATYFREAAALDEGSPWPGSLPGPTLFVEPETRYVVANQADAEGRLERTGGVFVGVLPEGEGIANTAVSWGGVRWTMLAWPLPEGYYERRRLLAHEMFHRLSAELGLPMSSPTNEHLDSAEGRLWLRAELRALVRALASSGAERERAVNDALTFRARRHALFPEGAEEERALERNEGLAEYTGIRASLPGPGRAGWAARWIETSEVRSARSGLSRNFAYSTGPAYGLLLDDARPGWQGDVDAGTDLAALLAGAHGVPMDGSIASAATTRLEAYDGRALEAFERTREVERVAEQAALRARYLDGAVLRLPVDEGFGYSFNPNAVTTLEGVGQVFGTAEVRGGWGTLSVEDGVLLERGERGVTGVVVPAPDDPAARPVAGPGWSLELAEGFEIVPGPRPGDLVVARGGGGPDPS